MVMHPLYVIFIIRMPQEKAITISIAAVNGGDSRNYDLCINSSNLGVDGVVDIIELLAKRELSSREALL